MQQQQQQTATNDSDQQQAETRKDFRLGKSVHSTAASPNSNDAIANSSQSSTSSFSSSSSTPLNNANSTNSNASKRVRTVKNAAVTSPNKTESVNSHNNELPCIKAQDYEYYSTHNANNTQVGKHSTSKLLLNSSNSSSTSSSSFLPPPAKSIKKANNSNNKVIETHTNTTLSNDLDKCEVSEAAASPSLQANPHKCINNSINSKLPALNQPQPPSSLLVVLPSPIAQLKALKTTVLPSPSPNSSTTQKMRLLNNLSSNEDHHTSNNQQQSASTLNFVNCLEKNKSNEKESFIFKIDFILVVVLLLLLQI